MTTEDVLELYNQPWRYHHTKKHVFHLYETNNCFSREDTLVYANAALFHDAVYEPVSKDNEEKSNELWIEFASKHKIPKERIDKVSELILLTRNPVKEKLDTPLKRAFITNDWYGMGEIHVIDEDYAEFLDEYETNIFKEFQKVPVREYVKGRIKFLEDAYDKAFITQEVSKHLRSLVYRRRKIGIYAGSFFPFHKGHLNVLRKAENLFDKVIIAVGINPQKTYDGDFRLNNELGVLPHHQVESYSGQLVDYINSKRKECDPVLIRGLRDGYDLSQEIHLARFLDEQAETRGIEKIPITYISCDRDFEHISSSAIRALLPEDRKKYIPDPQ